MIISNKRIKNLLTNKIIIDQVTDYSIVYFILDKTNTHIIKKKLLTKKFVKTNFLILKQSTKLAPLYYTPFPSAQRLIENSIILKKNLICNIIFKNLYFKNINAFTCYNINNVAIILCKLKITLNILLYSFIFLKNNS